MSEFQGTSAREPGSGPGPGRRKTVRKGMFVRDCKYPDMLTVAAIDHLKD